MTPDGCGRAGRVCAEAPGAAQRSLATARASQPGGQRCIPYPPAMRTDSRPCAAGARSGQPGNAQRRDGGAVAAAAPTPSHLPLLLCCPYDLMFALFAKRNSSPSAGAELQCPALGNARPPLAAAAAIATAAPAAVTSSR